MASGFQVYYSSQKGPCNVHGVTIRTKSPKGQCSLQIEGKQNEFENQIKSMKQDEDPYDKKIQEYHHKTDFFDMCNMMGIEIDGSQEQKQQFLTKIGVQKNIEKFTVILNSDYGAQIYMFGMFKDSKNYYRIQSSRVWPGYQP